MRRKAVFACFVLLALAAAAFFGGRHPENELPGVFAQGGYALAAGQAAGKVLVVDGDARIDGRVRGWVAVVGGNLLLSEGARVSGPMLVVGGAVTAAPGFMPTGPGWLVVNADSPLIPVLLWGLAAICLAAVFAAVILGWLAGRLAARYGVNAWLKRFIELNRQRWPALFALTGLAVSAFLLALFVHLAEETVYQQEAALIDNVIIWAVHRLASPAWDKAMVAVTYSGSGYAYALLGPPVLALLYYRGLRRECASLAVCLGGAAFLNWALKHFFVRARPDIFRVVSETGYSFPSGHAMVSLCFYGMLAYIIGRQLVKRGQRLTLYAFTGALVAVIGFSRIYLGVHYPSDVAAGYIAGGTWLAFCVSLLWWWELKK